MGDLGIFLTNSDPNFRSVRIPALYSDFREQRATAPQSFYEKVDAWKQALCKVAWGAPSPQGIESNHLIITINGSLLQRLKTQRFGSPQALGTVIREALASKDMYRLSDFLQSKQSIYSYSLSALPWAALSWAVSQVWPSGNSGSEDRLETGTFVLIPNLNAALQRLSDVTEGLTTDFERIFTKDKFIQQFATEIIENTRLSYADMEALLVFASRDKGAIAYDGKTVKLLTYSNSRPEITEDDASVASLKSLVEDLQMQTELMHQRVQTLAQQAKEALAKNNRLGALSILKTKKLTETALEARYTTMHQLESVMRKLEQASDNVQLVKNMESAAAVLQGLNEEAGGVDKVDTVVQNLRDHMADVDEIGTVLTTANAAGVAGAAPAVDEDELDAELTAMEADEKKKAEEQESRARASAREKVRQDLQQAREVVELGQRLGSVAPVPNVVPSEAMKRLSLKERETA
ncbi:hypothetical protein TD95_003013 [Thielaviopsis punctulata]|uniref:SNF7 family protein n=1 Tax=Thielaviopsis punctulata TaxID=72032 RepID=A0A0F4ZCQ4_9PEZI|nr:hypothetical protein TD95_003013 [Thielaviopsis punctulata]